jgi:hypothetical protein
LERPVTAVFRLLPAYILRGGPGNRQKVFIIRIKWLKIQVLKAFDHWPERRWPLPSNISFHNILFVKMSCYLFLRSFIILWTELFNAVVFFGTVIRWNVTCKLTQVRLFLLSRFINKHFNVFYGCAVPYHGTCIIIYFPKLTNVKSQYTVPKIKHYSFLALV